MSVYCFVMVKRFKAVVCKMGHKQMINVPVKLHSVFVVGKTVEVKEVLE